MSVNRHKHTRNRARGDKQRFTVRGVRRDQVDIGKLSKALLGLAQAEAERQAQADHAARSQHNTEPAATSEQQRRQQGGAV